MGAGLAYGGERYGGGVGRGGCCEDTLIITDTEIQVLVMMPWTTWLV